MQHQSVPGVAQVHLGRKRERVREVFCTKCARLKIFHCFPKSEQQKDRGTCNECRKKLVARYAIKSPPSKWKHTDFLYSRNDVRAR